MASETIPGGCNIGCGTCAFREASDTRGEPYNVMKATLCQLGGVPFYCHYSKDGEDFHASKSKPPVEQLQVCEGWKAAMREIKDDPRFNRSLRIRKAFAELGLGALEQLVDCDDEAKRKHALKVIGQVVERLVLR